MEAPKGGFCSLERERAGGAGGGEESVAAVLPRPQEAEAERLEQGHRGGDEGAAGAAVPEQGEAFPGAGALGGEQSLAVPQPQPQEVVQAASAGERGLPAVAGAVDARISDPEKGNAGKTCHQCRQKRDLAVTCYMLKRNKLCPLKYCHNCLLNRYGENDEEVALMDNWACPKCRGICNCSCCMKKNGKLPTGILAHTAKASGYNSVHELLNNGSEAVAAAQRLSTPLNVNGSEKSNSKRALGTEDVADELLAEGDENVGFDHNAVSSVPIKKKLKRNGRINKSHVNAKSLAETNDEPLPRDDSPDDLKDKIVLPKGIPLTDVVGAELEDEDIGPAIQFYEFCRTFAEVLQIRKGLPERVLQDIAVGRGLRVVSSLVAEFHINLLSVIQEDRDEKPLRYSREGDAWIIDIGQYISESKFIPKELPLDYLSQGVAGYKNLSPSYKLFVLNFLCDETLSTKKLRDCMVPETKYSAKEKVLSAKEKEKELKQSLNNNMATPISSENGVAISIEENKNTISQMEEAKEVECATITENGAALSIEENKNTMSPIEESKEVEHEGITENEGENKGVDFSIGENKNIVSQIKETKEIKHAGLAENEGVGLSIGESKNIISRKKEAKQVKHAAKTEKKLGNTLRIKPFMLDEGLIYWKLDGYCYNTSIMLQEVDTDNLTGKKNVMATKDKWFMFTEDEEKVIEDCVSTKSKRRRRKPTQEKERNEKLEQGLGVVADADADLP